MSSTKSVRFEASVDDNDTVYKKSFRWLKQHPNVYDVVFTKSSYVDNTEVLELEYKEVE